MRLVMFMVVMVMLRSRHATTIKATFWQGNAISFAIQETPKLLQFTVALHMVPLDHIMISALGGRFEGEEKAN